MKTTLLKSLKRSVSLLVVVCLLVGMCPAVFAAETNSEANAEKIKYVSLGDSMANGYGLTGYGNVNGYLEESVDAYPHKLAEHFGWDLTQLAMSAMRAEDLHYILEYGKENAYTGDEYTKSEFINGRFRADCGGVEAAADMYQSSVADADVITLGVGNANFGVFLLRRITNAFGIMGGNPASDAWINFEDAIRECDEPTKAFIRQIRAEVVAKIYDYVPEEAKELADTIENAISYAVVSYMMNYAGCIERIVELNPDVEIILVGIMNTFTGMDLSYEGQTIKLGDLVGEVVESINLYLSTQPTVLQLLGNFPQAKFYYAESPDVDIIVNTFADQINNPDTILRDRVLTEVQGMIWPMLNATNPGQYVNITRADVEAYEAAIYSNPTNVVAISNFLKNNQEKLMSIGVYLAFERAIIEASQLDVLDAEAILKLASGLGDVFNGVQEKVEAHMTNNLDSTKMTTAITVAMYMRGSMEVADIYKYMMLPQGMSEVLIADDTIISLLNLFARMLIGNGIGCHPSAKGHDSLTAAIINSYESDYTASDAAAIKIEEAVNKVLYALEKYGPQDSNYYEITDDSYYVGIGDGSAASEQYTDYVGLFAAENRLDYKNLAKNGLLIQDAASVLTENKDDIAKADLITFGFSNVTLLEEALEAAISNTIPLGNPVEYNWESLVTAEGVAYVDNMLESIRNELVAAGISGEFTFTMESIINIEIKINVTDFVMAFMESYAYNALTYAYTMPEYINAVRAINPDAKILVVGMYNPFKGRSLEFEGNTLPIGDMLDTIVDFSALHAKVYSSLTENVIYVAAPEVENVNKGATMTVVEFAGAIMAKHGLYPNQAGHTYIKDQLVNALDINNTTPLMGDADLDGTVSVLDATLIQRYGAQLDDMNEKQLKVADFDNDGNVTVMDSTAIQRMLASLNV